jgi:peptidoglycan-N-acetylglucosamine deacetylase
VAGVAALSGCGRAARGGHSADRPDGRAALVALGGPAGERADHFRHRRDELAAERRMLSRGAVVKGGGWGRRDVALTFDDGPGPFTARIVAILRRERAPATFFQIGRQIAAEAGVEGLLRRSGLPVEDHTENHPPLAVLPPAGQQAELRRGASAILGAGLPAPRLFRPPYDSYDRSTLAIARRLSLVTVTWTVDPRDYMQPGVRRIVAAVLAGVRPGAIVLLHDGGGPRAQTVAALPHIIAALRRRGYQLVSVPRLLSEDPP